jgi:hypothetical protein
VSCDGGECPPGLVGPAGLFRIAVAGVEHDGAETPELAKIVGDLFQAAGAASRPRPLVRNVDAEVHDPRL